MHSRSSIHRPAAYRAQVVPLTDADLKRYAQQHGITIEFMANSKPISDPDTVKSLVFMANGQPVMVVVAGKASVAVLWSCQCYPAVLPQLQTCHHGQVSGSLHHT